MKDHNPAVGGHLQIQLDAVARLRRQPERLRKAHSAGDVRGSPAAGALLKPEDSEEKQLELL